MRQTGSVQEYLSEFEELINVVKGIDEENSISRFYTGLKPEMKEVIKMKEPKGLGKHIAAVVKMESSMFCQMLGGKAPSENRPYRSNASGTKTTQLLMPKKKKKNNSACRVSKH